MKYLIGLFLSLALIGCTPHHGTGVADTIPAVGGSIDKATAHVQSAQNLVNAAKPEANTTGQKLLAVAGTEQDNALTALKDAKAQTATAESERAKVEKKYGDLYDFNQKVTHGWGYRLQVWVARVFWIIVFLTIMHFVLLAVVPLSPELAPIFLKIATIINPAAWAVAAASAYHNRSVNASASHS